MSHDPPLRRSPAASFAAVVLALYLGVLLLLTFVPGTLDTSRDIRVQLRPFGTITPALRLGPGSFAYRQLVGNVLAFIPFGLLLPVARPRVPLLGVVLIGGLTSVAIEAGQLTVSTALGYGYRATDIDDVLLNTLGTAIGAGAVGVGLLVIRAANRFR